jgi:hypothetical protein
MHLIIAAAIGAGVGALLFGPLGAAAGAGAGVFVAEKMGMK